MKPRILLVEDDPVLQSALSMTLDHAGYAVTSVENGRRAMQCISKERIDLVITDVIMVGQDGIETIVQLKKKHPDVPIIAMSGGGYGEPQGYLRMASMLGANVTLEKPFLPAELLAAVSRLCPLSPK